MSPDADSVIARLGLEPLPGEGGWYRETYRAEADGSQPGARRHCTQIYFLLRPGETSAMHRVRSVEIFHHYMGDPVEQLQLGPDGQRERVVMGGDLAKGERPQVIVPPGWWQGARLAATNDGFALMGCTVSPGFEWDDFELATPEQMRELQSKYPDEAELIEAFAPAAS